MKRISSRKDFHKLLDELRLFGLGVEVGVWKGNFSRHLLQTTKLKKLYSVDAWDLAIGKFRSKWDQDQVEAGYKLACDVLEPFGGRSEILRMTSDEAAKRFNKHAFDFIYIDASHDYESVTKDMETWWDKLAFGGVFAGHDYAKRENEKEDYAEFFVIEAVDDYVKKHKLKLYVTKERIPSWYVVKPTPALSFL
jgi:hypothetical protein